MATSHAKAHFQRLAAAQAGEKTADIVVGTQYELMLAKLAEDRRRLKAVQSIERKADVKRQLLPEYQPWLDGVLNGDSGQQDDVLTTCMVWHIDVGNLAEALRLADYVIAHNLALPDQYQRSSGCLIAEECADYALRLKDGIDADTLMYLLAADKITTAQDMPDEVRAKLHKAIGYGYDQSGQKELALEELRRALELNDKVGVKKDIERIERDIRNADAANGGETNSGGAQDGTA